MPSETLNKKNGSPYRVLLAEDKDINQVMGVNMFKMLGCEVDLVKDGEQAVKMAKQNQYDIIFMDCEMPIVNGYEATKLIREYEENSQVIKTLTPIIALTAKVMLNDKKKCFEAGMDDYLTKPINKYEVSDAIQKWCAGAIDHKNDW